MKEVTLPMLQQNICDEFSNEKCLLSTAWMHLSEEYSLIFLDQMEKLFGNSHLFLTDPRIFAIFARQKFL